jgi:crossover junction endodeoxyribonuclease RuvC
LPDNQRILGIDPGSQVTGIGIIDFSGSGEPRLCYFGSIKTRTKDGHPARLKQIYHGLIQLIEQYQPTHIALEDIFYSENIKTAIVMGQVRGVSLLAAVNTGLEPAEYSPREVKLAVVGNGNASKKQVQHMVRQILRCTNEIQPADAADALAVALCHYNRLSRKI